METKKSKSYPILLILILILTSCVITQTIFCFTKLDKEIITSKTHYKEKIILNKTTKEKNEEIDKINNNIKYLENLDNLIEEEKTVYYKNLKKLEDKILNNELDKKIAFITFDDGPYYLTNKYLEVLEKYDVLATFFTIGAGKTICYDNYNYNCTEQYKKIADHDHTMANHTYSHGIFTGLYSSVDNFIYQLEKQEDLIKEKTGITTNITRFPGGSSTAGYKKNAIIDRLREKGYGWVDWTSQDGDGGSVASTTQAWNNFRNTISEKIEVVLFHDYSYITLAILPDVIEYLQNNNYILLPLFYESSAINK